MQASISLDQCRIDPMRSHPSDSTHLGDEAETQTDLIEAVKAVKWMEDWRRVYRNAWVIIFWRLMAFSGDLRGTAEN